MIELTEKAAKYAAEKANEVIANALAKAYEDGYRDGYKDREEEIPVDLRDNKTVFVDLGLPSGTLWADIYETENASVLYLPYEKAAKCNLPTEEQWYELERMCRWEARFANYHWIYYCIGPNGNHITFVECGFSKANRIENSSHIYFWISDHRDDVQKKAAHMLYMKTNTGLYEEKGIKDMFSGYYLPIRLVQSK